MTPKCNENPKISNFKLWSPRVILKGCVRPSVRRSVSPSVRPQSFSKDEYGHVWVWKVITWYFKQSCDVLFIFHIGNNGNSSVTDEIYRNHEIHYCRVSLYKKTVVSWWEFWVCSSFFSDGRERGQPLRPAFVVTRTRVVFFTAAITPLSPTAHPQNLQIKCVSDAEEEFVYDYASL